jgi:L-lactate dehydrogenase complex protein LldG
MDIFIEAVQSVGGECIVLEDSTAMSGTGDPDLREYFDGHAPQILRAHFGVIENGACWIDHLPEEDRTRYTLPEHLAILLLHDALVPTMHEAYARIAKLGIDDFGLFLSGPSKTADIEQALVIGAQGAISTKVFLVKI